MLYKPDIISGLSGLWAKLSTLFTPNQMAQTELNSALFQGLFRDVSDAMIISNAEHVITQINPACEQMFALAADEAVGQPISTFVNEPGIFAHACAMQVEVNKGPAQDPFEVNYLRKNGTTFPGETVCVPVLGEHKNIRAYITVVRDVSRRHSAEKAMWVSEKRLRTILDAIPSMIFVKNAESRFLAANTAVAKQLGLPLNEIIGKRHADIDPHTEQVKRLTQDDRDVINSGETLKVALQPYYDANGHQGWLQTVKVACDSDIFGEPALIGNAVDVTHLKETEDDLRRTKTEAEEASKAKSEFLSAMSHELRTPLNAILGFAQMLQYDPETQLTPTQNESIEHILDSAEHLLGMVNEILDLERIEADQFVLSVAEVDPGQVIYDCLKLIEPQAQKRLITIENRFDTKTYAPLRTDALRLRQVLMNLLSNAVKYNKPGGSVIVEGEENEHGFLRISITDTGRGIPDNEKKMIFQAFHRAGADPFVTQEGTGIGLSVAQLLAERMAGQIGFHSKEGEGSTFWVEIPQSNNKETLLWTDNMRVGVDAVDKDHQILVSLLNKASQRNVDDAELQEILESLLDYTHYHFRREELIMEICNYPEREAHIKIHEHLSAQVMELADAWRRERSPETLTTLRSFLRTWLSNHIMNVDTTLAPHTKGMGKKIRTALEGLQKSA